MIPHEQWQNGTKQTDGQTGRSYINIKERYNWRGVRCSTSSWGRPGWGAERGPGSRRRSVNPPWSAGSPPSAPGRNGPDSPRHGRVGRVRDCWRRPPTASPYRTRQHAHVHTIRLFGTSRSARPHYVCMVTTAVVHECVNKSINKNGSSPAKQRDPQVVFEYGVEYDAVQAPLQLLVVPQTESRQHRHTLVMIPVIDAESSNTSIQYIRVYFCLEPNSDTLAVVFSQTENFLITRSVS